jgi:lauroyl/myristoyl acyltransferase
MSRSSNSWFRRFAVRGVLWRHYLDFGVTNVPFYLIPITIFFWTIFFFFFAVPARRAVLSNLRVIRPRSFRLTNYFRAFVTLHNFAWTISDAADFKLNRNEFAYSIDGAEFLDRLAAAQGAVLLTAHMGNYDLGAAIFAHRFLREIRMVRAPETDERTAQHLDASLERAGGGAVRIAYNTAGMQLSFELLNALREGQIVSIQGDRVVAGVASRKAKLFDRMVRLPEGPFMLAFVAQVPIFPLFVVRSGYHRYKIIACPPIECRRSPEPRDASVDHALNAWCHTLENVIALNWSQWFSFVPIFE